MGTLDLHMQIFCHDYCRAINFSRICFAALQQKFRLIDVISKLTLTTSNSG